MIEHFLDKVRGNSGVAHGPLTPGDALAVLLDRVADLAQGGSVAVPASDPLLDRLGALDALAGLPLLTPDDPAWRDRIASCPVGVTGSLAAIAETGTVAIGHGPGNPRALSLVPDAHICLVDASTLVENFEVALPLALRDGLPVNLVWVSGPSRSADIEKQITLGVHGPRTYEAIVVAGGPASAR